MGAVSYPIVFSEVKAQTENGRKRNYGRCYDDNLPVASGVMWGCIPEDGSSCQPKWCDGDNGVTITPDE